MIEMKRFSTVSLVLLSLFVLAGVTHAQGPPPPPPPAKDYFPKLWKDFSSASGGFKARYPGDPTESSKSIQAGRDTIVLHSFSYGSERFIYYGVSYRDLPKAIGNEVEARKFLTDVRDNRMSGMRDKLKLLAEKEITRDGRPALFLELELFPDRRIRELDVVKGARHYNVI